MSFKNFFLPHPDTHKKAHLLSFKALLIYILFFIVLQSGFGVISKVKPGVLGISADLNYKEIIRLTNIEREKKGLNPLNEEPKLNVAAYKKGENMFAENYWAHFSPSGKDPWGFIQGEGYKFSYAGENLARNFYKPQDVVDAWMASPTHRDNLLNPHYTDMGISVLEGTLSGQQTVLVVQEFGAPYEAIAQVPTAQAAENSQPVVSPAGSGTPVVSSAPATTLVAQSKIAAPIIDPFLTVKTLGMALFVMLFALILLDLYIIRRRAVTRLTSRHLPHMAVLAVAMSTLMNMTPGSIL